MEFQIKTLFMSSTHRHTSTEDCYMQNELPKGGQINLVPYSDNYLLQKQGECGRY